MKRRLTREESNRINREAVIAAARRQFETRGYHGASLETIAREAGFSKGVIYSRFASKDDLFLAVLESTVELRRLGTERFMSSLEGPEHLPRLVEHAYEEGASSAAWQAAVLEFRIHASRTPALNARYARVHERAIKNVADFLAQLYGRSDAPPPADFRTLAVAFMTCLNGLLTEELVEPNLEIPALLEALSAYTDPVGLR